MTNTKENILTVKPEDKKMMNSVIWRSMTAMGGYQWEKQQALAFLYTMIPVINRYYKNPKDRIQYNSSSCWIYYWCSYFYGKRSC